MDETYLIYSGGDVFQSKLVVGLESAFDAVVQYIFGEPPDPMEEPENFDAMITIKNDFENQSFWRDNGNVWETDFDEGFVIVVRVQSLLN